MIPYSSASDPAPLGRAAAVVGDGGDVLDGPDLEAGRLPRPDRGLAARARALHEHVDLAHAVLLGAAGGVLRSHLRGERRGLARALEADMAGRGPRDHVAHGVGDRDDRVVERALDVGVAVGHVLLLLAAHLLGARALTALRRHRLSFSPVAGTTTSSDERWSGTPVRGAEAKRGRSPRSYFLPTFFLPATVLRGPLRVRALVW